MSYVLIKLRDGTYGGLGGAARASNVRKTHALHSNVFFGVGILAISAFALEAHAVKHQF